MLRNIAKIFALFVLVFVLGISLFSRGLAQSEEFRLGLTRNVGYSSGDQINGSMKMFIVGSTTSIKSVQYFIDGKQIGTGTAPGFDLSFLTTEYAFGYHDLSAIVQTQDDRNVKVAPLRFKAGRLLRGDVSASGSEAQALPASAPVRCQEIRHLAHGTTALQRARARPESD